MREQLITVQWVQFSVATSEKLWNAMLMISQSRVTSKATISTTWEPCSTSCRLINWRWTQPSHFWECWVASSLDLWPYPKEFTFTLTKSRPSKVCNLWGPSKSSEVCKADSPISEDSSQIFRVIVNYSPGLWKKVSLLWDKTYQKAFEDIKEYLTKPPVLVAPHQENHSYSM